MRPVKIQRSGIVGITGKIALVLVTLVFGGIDLRAQQPQPPSAGEAEKGSFLLTIFFRHDESKTLDQINAQLKAQGFYKAFPPEGTQVTLFRRGRGLNALEHWLRYDSPSGRDAGVQALAASRH